VSKAHFAKRPLHFVVILSEAEGSRSEPSAESKDPYPISHVILSEGKDLCIFSMIPRGKGFTSDFFNARSTIDTPFPCKS
jgi:hypothetical protein